MREWERERRVRKSEKGREEDGEGLRRRIRKMSRREAAGIFQVAVAIGVSHGGDDETWRG